MKYVDRATCCLLLVAMLGCGGSTGVPLVEITQRLSPSTIVTGDARSTSIESTTPTSVTFLGKRSDVVPGSVLVDTNGLGLLRKVTSVELVDGKTVAQTEDAALGDAFDSLHADTELPFNSTMGGDLMDEPGMTISWKSAGRASTKHGVMAFELDGFEIQKGIAVTGSFEVHPKPALSVHFDKVLGVPTEVKTLTVGMNIGATGMLTFKTAPGVSLGFRHVFYDHYFTPQVIGYLVFAPRLTIDCSIEGSAEGGLEEEFEFGAQVSEKATYVKGRGWSNSKSIKPEFSTKAKNVKSEFEIVVTPVRVTLAYELYGVVGPYASVSLPFVATAEEAVEQGEKGFHVHATAELRGALGFKAETPAGFDTFGASFTFYEKSYKVEDEDSYDEFFGLAPGPSGRVAFR